MRKLWRVDFVLAALFAVRTTSARFAEVPSAQYTTQSLPSQYSGIASGLSAQIDALAAAAESVLCSLGGREQLTQFIDQALANQGLDASLGQNVLAAIPASAYAKCPGASPTPTTSTTPTPTKPATPPTPVPGALPPVPVPPVPSPGKVPAPANVPVNAPVPSAPVPAPAPVSASCPSNAAIPVLNQYFNLTAALYGSFQTTNGSGAPIIVQNQESYPPNASYIPPFWSVQPAAPQNTGYSYGNYTEVYNTTFGGGVSTGVYDYGFQFGAGGNDTDKVSQVVNVTASCRYLLSYTLQANAQSSVNLFIPTADGVVLTDSTTGAPLSATNFVGAANFTGLFTAQSNAVNLTFAGGDPPGSLNFFITGLVSA